MEIINERKPHKSGNSIAIKNIYLGLVFIAAGVIWMCYNLDIINGHIFDMIFSWQMLLMALGGYFLIIRKWVLGTVSLTIGGIFAMTDWFGVHLPVSDVLLPMIVIAVGIVFLVQRY